MRTKVSFTINWLYVFILAVLGWGSWVQFVLTGSIDAHRQINRDLRFVQQEVDSIYGVLHERN